MKEIGLLYKNVVNNEKMYRTDGIIKASYTKKAFAVLSAINIRGLHWTKMSAL